MLTSSRSTGVPEQTVTAVSVVLVMVGQVVKLPGSSAEIDRVVLCLVSVLPAQAVCDTATLHTSKPNRTRAYQPITGFPG